jgi:hypothetical protein
MFGAVSEDEETQRHGMVYIYTSSAETVGTSVEEFKRPEIRKEYERLSNAIPIRSSALHVCLEEPDPNDGTSMASKHPALFNTMRALVILLLQHTTRVRTRVHQGTCQGRRRFFTPLCGRV